MALVTVRGVSYHMNDILKSKWDKIKDGKLAKVDEDRVYIVDGRERTGKSVFAIQQAAYIDETILDDTPDGKILPRITFTAKETLDAIRHTKSSPNETKVIIFDEAFRGMSSKGSLSRENKLLVQALMEMGQNNLVLFIVSPTFFLLELYPAILRSNALFHILKDKKSKRRYFRAFSYKKKAILYQRGVRKGWGYNIGTKHRGNFFGKYPEGDVFEKKYRKKKYDSLKGMDEVKEDHRWKKQRNSAIYLLHESGMTHKGVSQALTDAGTAVSPAQVGDICRKVVENKGKT